MIRQQQAQLASMQQAQAGSGVAIDDSIPTPSSERSVAFPAVPPAPTPGPRSSSSIRRSSRRSSQTATSPALRSVHLPHHGTDVLSPSASLADLSGTSSHERRSSRDEAAFYQAETTSLTRENQMLRLRIRELGKFIHSFVEKDNELILNQNATSTISPHSKHMFHQHPRTS